MGERELYRRNFSGKKKSEVLEKDALRKRNKRKETVLSEEEKRKIRETNRIRKQKERRRKIEDKIEKEKNQNNGNRLYTQWRNKYYRGVNCLQVNAAALAQKNFGVCLSTSEESEVESDEDMEQINATTQTSIVSLLL